MIRIFRDVLVPIVVLGVGVGATVYLFSTTPAEAEAEVELTPILVEMIVVETVTQVAKVHTTGRVEPDRQLVLIPEVAGRIVALSEELVPGGRFTEGTLMVRINPEEYQMGLTTEQSRVSQAKLEHALETERGTAAVREWTLVQPGLDTDNPLALREPHLDAAQSAVDSAEAGVKRARLNIDRTTILAPFNSAVVEESAEIGQVVGPSTPIATLIGTDHFRVRTSIPVEQLSLFELPGAKATITQEVGSQRIERSGTVERLSSQVDPSSQTAQIWVKIAAPLDAPEGQLPLLAGSFVSVSIDGHSRQVQVIPRIALYEARFVWVVGAEETLEKAELEIAWSDEENVYVTAGVAPGDRLVVSPISSPMKGMKVEVVSP